MSAALPRGGLLFEALDSEYARHHARIAELTKATPMLVQLDAIRADLALRGVCLIPSAIKPFADGAFRGLAIGATLPCTSDAMFNALKDMGFAHQVAKDYGTWACVHVKQRGGGLCVCLHVSETALQPYRVAVSA